MKILVTGNSGYVGSVLVPYLQAGGHVVRGYDSGYFAPCTLSEPASPDEQILGDVREFTAKALEGIEAVVHLAGLSNDPLGELAPSTTGEINTAGTNNVARAARDAGIERFVFASSCSLYGRSEGSTALDESCAQNPLTQYARSKVEGEAILRELTGPAFRPIALRFATAFGFSPRLRLDLVVNNLVAAGLARGIIALESDGTPWRPLIHVEDMAAAMLAALESDPARCGARAYNAGSERENYQISEIAALVADALGGLPITMQPAGQGGDQRSYNVAFGRLQAAFPRFRPRWNLRSGVTDLIDRLRVHFDPQDFDSDRYFRIRRVRSLLASNELDAGLHWAGVLGGAPA